MTWREMAKNVRCLSVRFDPQVTNCGIEDQLLCVFLAVNFTHACADHGLDASAFNVVPVFICFRGSCNIYSLSGNVRTVAYLIVLSAQSKAVALDHTHKLEALCSPHVFSKKRG